MRACKESRATGKKKTECIPELRTSTACDAALMSEGAKTTAARCALCGAAIPAGAKALPNPIPQSAEILAQARAHWADHCAVCHANNGSGEIEMGKNMYPPPPDMRQPATQRKSDGELFYVIKNGVRLTGMPAWGNSEADDADSWKLVNFIRHLTEMTSVEQIEMEKLNPKSAGELAEEEAVVVFGCESQ